MRISTAITAVLLALLGPPWAAPASAQGSDGKLRIIAFGAHPDDAEYRVAGVAALWAQQGHHVKLVSVTNGDIGHFQTAGGPLALRRRAEIKEAARILGIEASETLDIHDGELVPSLEYRKTIARLIREWRADIVFTHRPNDYHPDHRYTGVLVNDAAFMVTVPFFLPDVPPLKRNPVFFFYPDDFQKPAPFQPDIVVPIDAVIEKKVAALAALTSQVLEGGAGGSEAALPKTPAETKAALVKVRERLYKRFARPVEKYNAKLVETVGAQKAAAVKYAEAFELCEYGSRPTPEDLRRLFPLPKVSLAHTK